MKRAFNKIGVFLRRALKIGGSIFVGVAITTFLAVAMGWATFVEREMGTPVAQRLIYSANWFYGAIGLLGLNILLSAVVRAPKLFRFAETDAGKRRVVLERRLIPFYLAHLGVLVLLVGCWTTARRGTQARLIIPEGTAVDRAIDVDSRVVEIELTDLNAPDAEPLKLETPFSGGPLNWRDLDDATSWKRNVAEPVLNKAPEGSFFKDAAKTAMRWSQKAAYRAARLSRTQYPGTLYDANGVKVEILDYSTISDYAPVPPAKLTLTTKSPNGETTTREVELDFPFDENARFEADPISLSRRALRKTLDDGTRVVWFLADSNAEIDAFLKGVPLTTDVAQPVEQQADSRSDNSPDKNADIVALTVDGALYRLPLVDLAPLSRSGSPEEQLESLEAQRAEIDRRLKLERERTDVAEGTPESDVEPLQTESQDQLKARFDELNKTRDELARIAKDAESNPDAAESQEAVAARKRFERLRVVDYLASTWARLETGTPTSAEFVRTLEQMAAQTAERIDEAKKLDVATRLGDSGWRVVAFETTPTLLPGVDELQGWSAIIQLQSPQGDKVDLTLNSDLFERNRLPENGRIFGALWTSTPSGSDSEYGRPWNPNLGKPKLELAQSQDGAVYYRYDNGRNGLQTGKLELAPRSATAETAKSPEDGAALETFESAQVALDVAAAVDSGKPTSRLLSFAVKEFAFQTELGAALVPGPFQQERANEFYGKAKLRVSFDGVSETFWARTIPLESATPEQVKYLTKRIVSPKRSAVVRLTDRETSLGVALFVKKFTPIYEPGSSTAASFASVARVLPVGLTPEEQAAAVVAENEKDAVIQMNRPGVLRAPGSNRVFWAYQDSFRGPYRPGDREFDDVVRGRLLPGETTPRESLYYTIVSINDDPGRGLKYLGSLFIVWGTALLIYRRKNKSRRAAKSADGEKADSNKENDLQPNDRTSADRSSAPAKSTAPTLLLTAALAATFALVGTLGVRSASAQESTESQPKSSRSISQSAEAKSPSSPERATGPEVDADKLDWTAWRLLPVFDGGRRQPLDTFASILVRDVCGTDAPTFAIPPETLERLDGDKPLNFPDFDEIVKSDEAAASGADAADKRAWYDEVSRKVVERQRATAAKLRAVFPNGVRKFRAPEVVFSWIVEPEIWEYIPFLADPQTTAAQEVFHLSKRETLARFDRLSPNDFDAAAPGTSETLVDRFRKPGGASALDPDKAKAATKALDELERRVSLFRSLSFVPTQTPSSQPSRYLHRILYGGGASVSAMSGVATTGLLTKLDAATQTALKRLAPEDKALRDASPLSDSKFLLRKTTPISDDKAGRETLLLTRQINLLASVCGDYSPSALGPLFEKTLRQLEDALAALRKHRDEVFAAESYSVAYRQALQEVVADLSETADLFELAYLSLVSEPTKELNVVPVVRRRAFRTTESQIAPWVALQTIVWGPDSQYARFVDPTLEGKLADVDAKSDASKKNPVSPFATFDEAATQVFEASRLKDDRKATRAFLDAALAYRDKSAPDRAERFNEASKRFAAELRALAERTEPIRETLAAEEVANEKTRAEFLAKTAYPAPDALDAEFFYSRLNAFYWNWVACLLAVVAFAASYLRQLFLKRGSRSVATGSDAPREEIFFFALGLFFLSASCFVAFLGGSIRAYITGWAPVTNMFETVVLLAFLIAAIAIGHATYPVWGKPFANAWRASAFPRFKRGSRPAAASDDQPETQPAAASDSRSDAQSGVQSDDDSQLAKISAFAFVPRLVLTVLCVVVSLRCAYSEQIAESGLVATILDSFAMQGILDRVAVGATLAFVAWGAPRFLVALAALAIFPKATIRYDRADFDAAPETIPTRRLVLTEVVRRKAFLTASAFVALLVAASAYFNSGEFNPNIRPLVAVLRSNFWLTIHVFAIIVSYALGSIAWVVAMTSLTAYIFGRYATSQTDEASKTGATSADVDPPYCRRVAPFIAATIRSAVLFLTIGIILGARWADFSWGRFWSWDPKEVWALVTLLIYLVVLHALKARRAGRFGLTVGAVLGALAIVTTWYGLSFVMGGGGRHAYAAGESNKVAIMYILIAANVAWAALASVRYWFEKKLRRRSNGETAVEATIKAAASKSTKPSKSARSNGGKTRGDDRTRKSGKR